MYHFSVSLRCITSQYHFSVSLLCITSLYHFSISLLCITSLYHFSVSLLCITSLYHFSVSLLYITSLYHFSVSLLCITSLYHFSVSLLCITSLYHFFVSLLCITSLYHFSVSLLCLKAVYRVSVQQVTMDIEGPWALQPLRDTTQNKMQKPSNKRRSKFQQGAEPMKRLEMCHVITRESHAFSNLSYLRLSFHVTVHVTWLLGNTWLGTCYLENNGVPMGLHELYMRPAYW